jgi:hypothetical protein
MKTDFICPKCNGHLLVGEMIIFVATSRKEKQSGIVLLSQKLGDYSSILHPSFKVEKTDEVDFFCPICRSNLCATDVHEKLVKIMMIDEKSEQHEIYFSGVLGERCTYKVSKERLEKFGEASEKYYEYFMSRRI